jgi:hypothetical protein
MKDAKKKGGFQWIILRTLQNKSLIFVCVKKNILAQG